MGGTPSQSSCSTGRLCWDEGTFIPASRRWFTRSRSRGRSPMGTIQVTFTRERTDLFVYRVFLVTVHDPICTESGNPADALYGSFLPVPTNDLFPAHEPSAYAHHALPGAIIVKNERIVINHGRQRVRIKVTNNGDRPVQVSASSSHCRIRREIKGYRLDLIITSLKLTLVCPSIAPAPTESDSTSPQVRRSDSSQATRRRLLSAPSPETRSSLVGTNSLRVS